MAPSPALTSFTSLEALPVAYSDVERAAEILEGIAHRTPVMTSRLVDQATDATVFFKCENFQRTGAFKFRGAYNAIHNLVREEGAKGVLTYSSGNHAQAIALSAQLLGVSATIIMPQDAPAVKKAATASYGAEIILYDKHQITREALAKQVAAERGLPVIPPYDHPFVVAGQGTSARELLQETGPLDALLVCCGGGGMLSGSALSTRALSPYCRVIGVEPALADDATRSFYSGSLQSVHNPDTIADGARTPSLGSITYPIVMNLVDDMIGVSESAILEAMFFLWERLKIVVEPTGALAAAALLSGAVSLKQQRVGVIITGGNVDLKALAALGEASG